MKNFYDYMIARYGNQNASPSLYQMIQELEGRMNVLEEKYNGALEDIKRLEEENVETTNTLYEIMHSVDAVDARIDIVADDWGDQFNG
jgi:chromosome segregation ATPase